MAKRKWGSDDEMEYHQISRGYDGSITPDGWRDYNGELVECTLETGKVVKGLLRAKGNSEKNPSIRSNPICWLSNKPAERLHTPSLEQKAIIDSVLSGNSVLCASVAGRKTTTVLSIAEAMQRSDLSNNRNPRPILMLTYSAKLKEDSRQRVGLHKLENLTVHSYHSFYHLSKEYPCKNDKQMKDILANDNQLRRKISRKEVA